MKKPLAVLMLLLAVTAISFAQQNASVTHKYALVIGNGSYTGLSRLSNPVNDANDITAALQELGFTVDTVLNGNLDQMEKAIMRLKNRLSVSRDSYGFFFYAGHGVQSGGSNYLIPVGASIPSENALRERAVSVQYMLSELNDAGNELNVIVLDACRDNPFGWARSGSRGLTVVSNQPADSIIVYATSAGSVASDGTGRNGLFTSHLLDNLKTPGLDIKEIFDQTGAAVSRASERRQIPAIYSQYFGKAYFNPQPAAVTQAPVPAPVIQPAPVPAPSAALRPAPETQLPAEAVPAAPEAEPAVEAVPAVSAAARPSPQPAIAPAPRPVPAPKPSAQKKEDPARYKTLGFSAGTSFADPVLVATVHGTIAPARNIFIELGLDIGFVSMYEDVKSYFSVYPFTRLGYFAPFRNRGGWYIGAGAGFMTGNYTFDYGEAPVRAFAADVVTGFNFLDILNISYSLKTDFGSASSKLAFGIVKRFK
ncbi:MAG: caspase family protein [Treponema sp.]|jgi:uncharacterized caspase-like protein|nr:caspase family protein [Treponema sp.]